MLEVEEGPSRRVSRGRKRASHGHDEGKTNTEQTGRCLRSSRQSREADWFSNSMQSNTARVTSPENQTSKCISSSTPKAKRTRRVSGEQRTQRVSGEQRTRRVSGEQRTRRVSGEQRTRRVSGERDNLNTSDALFADLDIDSITSQALSQSQPGYNITSTQSGKENKNVANIQDENKLNIDQCLTDKSSSRLEACTGQSQSQTGQSQSQTGQSQSQYFVKKFGNYRSTQQVGRKEVIVENRRLSGQTKSDSSFSFSFIGDDTQISEDISNKFDQSRLKVVTVGPKEALLNNNLLSDKQLRAEPGGHKFRCTPFFKTEDLSVSVIDTQDLPRAECGTQSQFCIPDGTQSKEFAAVLDTTQLKDAEGFKYRCTPYKTKCKDLCTQTQTQCDLMAGTQFQSYLHESYKDSQSQLPIPSSHSKQSQICYREKASQFQPDSQIPCTGLCDMTGVIVESQNKDALVNTSDCDMFSDSVCDDNSQENACHNESETRMGQVDTEISSHTQGLNCPEASQTAETRTQSLEDDLECIIQESQNQRIRSKLEAKAHSAISIGSKHDLDMGSNTAKLTKNSEIIEDENKNKQVTSHIQEKSLSYGDKVKCRVQVVAGHQSRLGQVPDVQVVAGHQSRLGQVPDVQVVAGQQPRLGQVPDIQVVAGHQSRLGQVPDVQVVAGHQSRLGQVPDVPTTPGGAGSLQDRIKKRLKDNAGRRTPQGPGVLMEQLREQVLERVSLEAELKKESTNNDIGPFYGLPKKVKHLFENYRGIKNLYDWQDECLRLPSILERKNLIYSLPTSGGKTLVAEILILQEILCNRRDALLILPFVSIVQEKVRNMSQFAVDLNFYVEEYAGSKGRFPPIKRRNNHSLYIATIEKAQSIVNSLIENDRIENLGLVVVDELHMLGEGGSRGSTLEATLMKLLHSSGLTQIIGMSATLNNIEDLQKFLNADIYCNDFRPVTLTEHVKLTENIYRVDQKAMCPDDQLIHDRIVCFEYPPEMSKTDPDHILGLALEVIPDHSCLVFCPTKKNCENVALMLSKLMAKYKRELLEVKKKQRRDLLKELNSDSEGKICPVLQYTVHFGVAYHHSGLTVDERKLIEEAYSEGTLCLLACTSTLAAGVNLPAKRVILRSPYVGQYFISRSQYKQMVGRAGRAGIDSSGESILICKSVDREKVRELLVGPIESCHSSLLYNEGKGIRSLILSTIGLKITSTTEDVFKFVSRSLVQCQESVLNTDVSAVCRVSLQRLIDGGLVTQLKSQSEDPQHPHQCHSLEVTRLGKATFKGPVDPDYAEMLFKDLKKAEESLVISNHLHLLYLVTPYDAVSDTTPSWFTYFNQMSHFNSSELKVASLIGVPESHIARKASQQRSRQKVDEFVVSRFYLTLMLYDLWKEKSVWEVAEKFEQPRGFVQNLLSSAASFASCVARFCQELEEFWAYQDLMGNFVKRLSYCVTSELIPLVEIPGVKLGRARLMYTAGYKSLSSVASANPEDLVKSVQYMPRKAARQIVASAKLLLSEKAEAMMEEVEALVTVPHVVNSDVAMTTDATPAAIFPGLSQTSVSSDILIQN